MQVRVERGQQALVTILQLKLVIINIDCVNCGIGSDFVATVVILTE